MPAPLEADAGAAAAVRRGARPPTSRAGQAARLALGLTAAIACAAPTSTPPEPRAEPTPGPVEPAPRAPAPRAEPAEAPRPRLVDLASRCDGTVAMLPAHEVVGRAEHPCREWVEAVLGRVATVGWTTAGGGYWARTEGGRAVFLTCRHCVDIEAGLRAPATSRAAAFPVGLPPEPLYGGLHSRRRRGELEGYEHVPAFGVFARALRRPRGDPERIMGMPVRDDFVVAIVTGDVQRYDRDWTPPSPLPGAPAIHVDPRGLTRAAEVTAAPAAGERVLGLGFPGEQGGQLVITVARVLDDADARARVAGAERDEARIPYEAEAELLLPARAVPGMSGGPVFDDHGRLVGVMVRGSTTRVRGAYFTRVLRAAYVAAQLRVALDEAPPELRRALEPLLAPVLR